MAGIIAKSEHGIASEHTTVKQPDEAALLAIIAILQRLPADQAERVLASVAAFFGFLRRRDG